MDKLIMSMSAGIGVVISVLAGIDWFLVYLYCFLMMLDLATGWYKSAKNGSFESSKMKEGLIGKVLELIIVFALLFWQKALADIGIVVLASNVILFCFAAKELMSVLENWREAGKTIPKFIQNWIKQSIDKLNNKEGEE